MNFISRVPDNEELLDWDVVTKHSLETTNDTTLPSKPKVKRYIPKILGKRNPDGIDKMYPAGILSKIDGESANECNQTSNIHNCNEELQVATYLNSESSSGDVSSHKIDDKIENNSFN